ncbi:sensor histidine kinase [Pseudomonas segetis]|uniref:histidine kinase n=1 Tax=Pseudomonas segetis TaxID=298908 RepID=A0A239CVV1_9PSED|nr:HAMP domain-containing sensor histidine kinase [Pseudomonas segetis]SNS24049.1 Signal transduction histidine kinase [Pseudomonas segetis]
MVSKQPLLRRIVIAFVLMTFCVSGLFSLSIVAVVHFIEANLVSQELDEELLGVLQHDLANGLPPRLDSRTRFFASDIPRYAVPEQYAKAPEGYSESVDDTNAVYIFKRNINGQSYLLVQEQHEFEEREVALYRAVLAGFVFSVILAWVLGLWLARRIVAPVVRLAGQVRHRDQLHHLAPNIAPDYADDEVGHLAQAFDSTLGQLRKSLEREQLFTSDVSHELRTPLMVINSSCELLEVAPNLEPRQRVTLQRIKRATDEMGELVQTFLLLARSTNNWSIEGGTSTLGALAQEQGARWGEMIKAKGLHFEVVDQGADDTSYNLTLLRTVMSNLLRNALHYTEEGTVRLVLTADGFCVEDSGVGIPPEQHEKMFQPFVRGQQARGEGLGLGLSLVKRICAHEGWTVNVKSLATGGSEFRVILKAV